MPIEVHRVYDLDSAPAGRRFLVDRLWPRGVTKEKLGAEWLKDVAPSNELRKWYQHDPARRSEFQKRYFAELDRVPEAWKSLVEAARTGPVVLLYSSKETEINNAVALKMYLERKLKRS
jgi:uncharacterized protein YeaO (DUF488 family)